MRSTGHKSSFAGAVVVGLVLIASGGDSLYYGKSHHVLASPTAQPTAGRRVAGVVEIVLGVGVLVVGWRLLER